MLLEPPFGASGPAPGFLALAQGGFYGFGQSLG
jgi:hypothetical protein